MFEWVPNAPLKLVEHNLKIYLKLFKLKQDDLSAKSLCDWIAEH